MKRLLVFLSFTMLTSNFHTSLIGMEERENQVEQKKEDTKLEGFELEEKSSPLNFFAFLQLRSDIPEVRDVCNTLETFENSHKECLSIPLFFPFNYQSLFTSFLETLESLPAKLNKLRPVIESIDTQYELDTQYKDAVKEGFNFVCTKYQSHLNFIAQSKEMVGPEKFNLNNQLIRAIGHGNFNDVSKKLNEGADPNSKCILTGFTALITLITRDLIRLEEKESMVQLLLDADADPNLTNERLFPSPDWLPSDKQNPALTPLMFAIRKEHVKLVDLLLKNKKIQINNRAEGQTPLTIAAHRYKAIKEELQENVNTPWKSVMSNIEKIKLNEIKAILTLLLERGADPAIADKEGKTVNDLIPDFMRAYNSEKSLKDITEI